MSEKGKIVLGSNGIKKVLKGFSPVEAVAEYIWNGYDANATIVNVQIDANSIEGINSITISDNGSGIAYETLDQKFKPFYESNKTLYRNEDNSSSALHGKNGIGRLTFFAFAHKAKWITTYRKDDKFFRYSIEISENDLADYSASEPQEVSSGETGTVVEFESIKEEVIYSDIIEFLKVDFAWYVELNRYIGIELRINGEKLDYSSILMEREEKQYAYGEYSFEVIFCRWEKRLHQEYSKYYDLSNRAYHR